MSVDRKEIDLIIRAALQGGKTLSGVSKSITEIEEALEAQAKAAKRGEASIDDLRATLLALQRVQDQLKDQAGLIGQYDRLSKQIAKTVERVDAAARAHTDYRDKVEKAGKATDYQRERLVKLAAASERVQVTLAKQRTDQGALAETLREAGVEVGKLAASEDLARQSAARLGIAISKTHESIASYSEDVRKAREAERKLAEEKAFQQKLRDAADMTKASEYVRFWTEALHKADVAEQQLKLNTSLQRTADEAMAAARGYKTLGTAAKSLSGSSGSLRELISGITDPAKQARQTLAGVEAELRAVGTAVTAIKGPISDYREKVKQLVSVQRAITSQAGLVDEYSRQAAALRTVRGEYAQARAKVLQYAEAMRSSGGASDQLEASLRQAQSALAATQQRLTQQITITRSARDAMREAGLATNNLAQTQARLTSAAQTGTAALKQLESAHRRYGEAARISSTGNDIFVNSGRTTLSFLQRMRGEVLSLMAAYVGLYGAISGTKSVVDAFNKRIGVQNQIGIAVGNDPVKIADELAYLDEQAQRLGVSLETLQESYAKFLNSSVLMGASKQETRFIFETFTEIGRVANITKDDMEGVFKALGQMMSKAKIQSEELRGQLADRLFGVFGIAKEALKEQFPDFDKALKEGKVGAEYLLKIAESYKSLVAGQLSNATGSLAANQERLNNEILKFKLAVAEQGFATEFSNLVERLTRFFQSDDGKNFAKDLSDGLSAVMRMLAWMVENSAMIKELLIVGVFVFGARAVATFGLALAAIPAQLAALSAAAATAGIAVKSIHLAFAAVTAGAIGWSIGTILREKFEVVRKAGVALVIGLESAWVKLKYGAMIAWEEIPAVFADGLATIGNLLTQGFRQILGLFSAGARALGRTDLADTIDKVVSTIEFRVGRIGNASAKLRAEMQSELEKIQEIGMEMWKEAERPGASAPQKAGGKATANPGVSGIKASTAADEKEAERRIKNKEQLENELTAIEAKIERNEKESLTRRLAAIDLEYRKLLIRIRKLGGAEAAGMESRLSQAIANLKLQETRKFNESLLKEQTDLQKKLEDIDAKTGRSNKTDIDKRLAAVKLSYQDTYREIEEFRQRLEADGRDTGPAEAMKGRLDAGIVALQNMERQKYFEDSINTILEERKAKLETITTMEKAGLITAVQARERAAEIVTQTQPKIEAVTQEALKYVEAMIMAAEATGANTAELETLRAKLIEARTSASGLRTELFSAAQINEMLANGAEGAFVTMADSIGGAIMGLNSWQDAIRATRNAFVKFAADFLQEIGKMILKQAMLNALQSSGGSGGIGGGMAGMFNGMFSSGASGASSWFTSLFHQGGIVGSNVSRRAAMPQWFANAPRYHGGGIAGLAPDEYPAILRKNEEVLTQNDPRNVLNGGGSAQSPQNLKIINMIDSGSVVSEGLSTQSGEKAFFNFIRANRTGLRNILA